MSKKQEIATVDTKSNLPALPPDIDFAADMEDFGANYSAEQMTTPFLNILQALSPQVTRGKAEFMKDAQAGQLFNTVTKDLFDGEKGIQMILSNFKESYIEWVPRNKGGGFVAEYDMVIGGKAKTLVDPDFNNVIQDGSPIGTPGNFLTLTHTRLGAIVKEDQVTWSPVVLSMSSSALKVSRGINSLHRMIEWINPSTGKPGPLGKCPMPLILWNVKTITRSNDNGTWFTWDFSKNSFLYELPSEKFLGLYRSIRDFAASSKGKKIMEDAAQESVTINQPRSEDSGPILNDEIPF